MPKQTRPISGWINLNKPLGMSSAQAVGKVKWLLKPAKIGHAGTLDPLATGVLPLALGEGTKCVNLLMDAKKTYEFSVTFGEERSTADAEGEVTATSDARPTAAQIEAVLPRFMGRITQVPPIYSALKIDGKRAYELARAGEAVEMKSREVTIYALEFLGLESPEKASSPCGRRLEEGVGSTRAHLPLAAQQQILHYAKSMRQTCTDAEKLLWGCLRSKQLEGIKFRRQQPINQYIVDFACMQHRLLIELDGGQHAQAPGDSTRTAYFERHGFRVLRFWNHDVLQNIEGVVAEILAALEQGAHAPPPNPPPQEGRAYVGHFRATVSKGTYIRALGIDIARAAGALGFISRLHRAAVGPFSDKDAISLDFLEKTAHNAAPTGDSPWLLPLRVALDDIPAISLTAQQATTLRHGQHPLVDLPDTALAAAFEGEAMLGLVRVEGRKVIAQRLLNTSPDVAKDVP